VPAKVHADAPDQWNRVRLESEVDSMIRTPSQATVVELEREVAVLEDRLRDGERRIEEARLIGAETDEWEEFWIELLHTYEFTFNRLLSLQTADRRIAA
jgi:hypothetical protein